MNFNFPLLKPVRLLLFPFSLLYWLAVFLRNRLYDAGIFKSAAFNLPVICIGNIAVGGTGKSPMVEYLVKQLKPHFSIATLSRGYKRKTRGYALANDHSTALEIGDEPMQFHLKYPEIAIAVGEDRLDAITQILHDKPGTEAVILDDAFQHRTVKAGLNIVLTDYNNLYTRDWYLPSGDLRDEKKSMKRADIIVVTKCNSDMPGEEKASLLEEINPAAAQQVFFTGIQYGQPYHLVSKSTRPVTPATEVLLVTGIANPAPLKSWLQDKSKTYYELRYNDHYIFTIDDLKDIMRRFNAIGNAEKMILTTEKDAVRMAKFGVQLQDIPIYAIPITMQFLFNGEAGFNQLIGTFIRDFSKRNALH
jgi:tetraacyldisaccharide 4'-kinase